MDVFKIGKFRFRKKIAAFDYDHTIIKPKSSAVIPKDFNDWTWLRPNVPNILQKIYEKGYCIMIFTNQSKDWKIEQIKFVLEKINIPIYVSVARNKDFYKPNPSIFYNIVKKNWDKKSSFYCGDALGRAADWSDNDLLFAKNIGIKIREPEEIFPLKIKEKSKTNYSKKEQEMIIMIGYPGSGKTTLASTFDKNQYEIISGDELKTVNKMLKVTKEAIENKKSVIIDSTNPSKKRRAIFIEFAKHYNIPVRCFYIDVSMEEAIYRNNQRDKGVPKIVYNIFKKKFEYPTTDEGCQIIKV